MENSSKKVIEIAGKEFDYGSMSDEKILMLYNKLLERNNNIIKKINELQIMNDVNINNL